MKTSKKTIKRVRGICLLVLGLSAMFVVWGYDPIAVKIMKSATVFFLLSLCVDIKSKKKKKEKDDVVHIDLDNVKTFEERMEQQEGKRKHLLKSNQ